MRIVLPLVVLALLVGGFFLFQDDSTQDQSIGMEGDLESDAGEVEDAALLQGSGTEASARDREGARSRETPSAPPTQSAEVDWFSGSVVAADTGAPIAGAHLWAEPAREPCPRVDLIDASVSPIGMRTASGADGRFVFRYRRGVKPPVVDVLIRAPGYVGSMACGVSSGQIEVKLERARVLRGVTQDSLGRPVPHVSLRTRPREGVAPSLRNSVAGRSNERGEFVLNELGSERVLLEAHHEAFIAWRGGPFAPGSDTPITVSLVPAWRLQFVLRTDDGQEPKNPRVTWVTDGEEPRQGLQILPLLPRKDDERGPPVGFLTVPCDRARVSLEIEADGYLPWVATSEPIPPEGGEHTFEVLLKQDLTQGKLRIFMENPDGARVSYIESGGRFSAAWLGTTQGPTGIPSYAREALEISSVPAGPYRFTIYARDWMPATLDLEVVAGETRDVVAKMALPAKLRVRFAAPAEGLVRFRVLRDGQPVHAFPVDAEHAEGTPEHPGAPPPLIGTGGAAGLLLSGLAGGTHTIEVHPDPFQGTKQTVTLTPGETTEVEITLSAR